MHLDHYRRTGPARCGCWRRAGRRGPGSEPSSGGGGSATAAPVPAGTPRPGTARARGAPDENLGGHERSRKKKNFIITRLSSHLYCKMLKGECVQLESRKLDATQTKENKVKIMEGIKFYYNLAQL